MLAEAVGLIKSVLEVITKGLELEAKNLAKDHPKYVRASCNTVFFALSDLEDSSRQFLTELEEVLASDRVEPWHIYQLYDCQRNIEKALKSLSKARQSAFRTLDIYERQTYALVSGVEQIKTAAMQEIDGFLACIPRIGLVDYHQDAITIREPSQPPDIKKIEGRYPVASENDLDREVEKEIFHLQNITPSREVRFRGRDNDRSYLDAGYKNIDEIIKAKESLRQVLLVRYPDL